MGAILGENIILYKIDTSTIPATETPFACSTSCSFSSTTDMVELASPTNAYFKVPTIDLSNWNVTCDGLTSLSGYGVDDIANEQKNRTLFLIRFAIDNEGVFKYISGYCFISSYSISGGINSVSPYSVSFTGTGIYYTDATPTTTTSTTSTTTSTTSTSTTSTTTTSTSTTSTSTTTSTTTSTSTTTTRAPVWYSLFNCGTGATTTSTSYPDGSFSLDERVTSTGQTFRIDLINYTDPGGAHLSIVTTGLTGCPATTTTTTTSTTLALVDFSLSYTCSGGTAYLTSDTYTGGAGTYEYTDNVYATQSAALSATAWTAGTSKIYYNQDDTIHWVAVRDAANPTNRRAHSVTPSCATTTTTSTTTRQAVWYNLYNCGTGAITTSTNYLYGDFAVDERVTSTGQTFRITSQVTTDPGGAHLSILTTGLTGCPTTTTTTTTTTLAPLSFSISYTCSGTNAVVTINSFAGGSGGYSYGNTLFNYSSDAYANTAWTSGTSNTYGAQSFAVSGQLWAVIKDSNGNKLALSVTPTCTTTTTTTTTTTIGTPDAQFYLTLDPGNSGSLAIYKNGSLNTTLTFDGASTAITMNPSDTFYCIITQTARANSTQRGQIISNDNGTPYDTVNTSAGALPKSRTSATQTVVTAHLYQVYGYCGDLR